MQVAGALERHLKFGGRQLTPEIENELQFAGGPRRQCVLQLHAADEVPVRRGPDAEPGAAHDLIPPLVFKRQFARFKGGRSRPPVLRARHTANLEDVAEIGRGQKSDGDDDLLVGIAAHPHALYAGVLGQDGGSRHVKRAARHDDLIGAGDVGIGQVNGKRAVVLTHG